MDFDTPKQAKIVEWFPLSVVLWDDAPSSTTVFQEKDAIMTIAQLARLANHLIEEGKGKHTVILSRDAEGNGFNPTDHYDEIIWKPRDNEIETEVDYMDAHNNDPAKPFKPNAIVLWPR